MNRIVLVIKFLSPFQDFPQEFGGKDQTHAAPVTIDSKKVRHVFPGEIPVFVDKGINNEEQNQTGIEEPQQLLNILPFIE